MKERLWKEQLGLLRSTRECEKPANIAVTAVVSTQMEAKYLASHNSHWWIGGYKGSAKESSATSTNHTKYRNLKFSVSSLESSWMLLNQSDHNVNLGSPCLTVLHLFFFTSIVFAHFNNVEYKNKNRKSISVQPNQSCNWLVIDDKPKNWIEIKSKVWNHDYDKDI